jgi:hypothetical protein
MTSRADGGEHAVMATELEQANRTGEPPVGLCGALVDPAPLGLTARHVCRSCREAVARRRHDAHLAGRLPAAPWTLLVHWYEALVRLLRGGLPVPAQKALTTGAKVPLALPATPARLLPPPVPVDRPVPSPRTRTSPPLHVPHPARGSGGRHRRD